MQSSPFGEGPFFQHQISPTGFWFHPQLSYLVPPFCLSSPSSSLYSPGSSQLENNSIVFPDPFRNQYENAFYAPREGENSRRVAQNNEHPQIEPKREEEEILVETPKR